MHRLRRSFTSRVALGLLVVAALAAGVGGATTATTPIVAGGPPVSVTITVPGGTEALTFEGNAGQRVSLGMSGVTIGSSTCCSAKVSISNPDATSLVLPTNVGRNGGFIDTRTLPATGTYTILVDAEGTATGSITLTLYDVPPDVLGPIAPGGPAASVTTSVPGQNAKLTFTGATGQRVSLQMTAVTTSSSKVSILNPSGTTLATVTVGTNGGFIDTKTLPTDGAYTVLVDPVAAATGGMTLTLYDVPPDAVGTIVAGGPSATVATTVAGQNARVTFPGAANQRVSLRMSAVTIGPSTTSSTKISILKPDGTTLASQTIGTNGGFMDTKTLPTAGNYTILVDPQSVSTGSITLTLNDVPTDVAAAITFGGTTSVATTAPGQNARVTFDGVAGQAPTLNVAWSASVCCLVKISILKPGGAALTSPLSVGTTGAFIDVPSLPVTGTYTILVDPVDGAVGTATLTLSDVPDVTGTLTPNGAATTVTTTAAGQDARLTFPAAGGDGLGLTVGPSCCNIAVSILKPDGTTLVAPKSLGAAGGTITASVPAGVSGTFTVVVDYTLTSKGSVTLKLSIDNAPPTPPALTLTEASADSYVAGTALYYRPTGIGSTFTVTATTTDVGSGVQRVRFPALGGGMTPATALDDTASPYTRTYTWPTGATYNNANNAVTAYDKIGNSSTSSFAVLPDATPPNTTDDTAVIGSAWKNTTQVVTLTPIDTGSGVAATYSTTNGATPTILSPQGTTITLSADGAYTIKYYSIDNVANAEPVRTAGSQVRIDKTLPTSTFTFPVAGRSYNAAGWTGGCAAAGLCGTASDASAGVENVETSLLRASTGLYWDGTAFASPTQVFLTATGTTSWSYPFAASAFPGDGTYTVSVRATDKAGNVQTAVSRSFTYDTAPPDTTIASTPANPANSSSASFSFSSEAGATFQCRLDAGAFSACTSPRTYTGLVAGTHTFEVRATDGAGNVDPTPASFTWTIDTTAPNTTITASPTSPTSSTSASFSFTSTEPGTFECRLDGSAYAVCTSPQTYTGLTQGSHAFDVRARDTAGNVDTTPATFTWTVDTAPPNTTITTSPSNPTNATNASFSFTSTEAGSSFECRLDGAAFAGCTSPRSYTALAAGFHTFEVRATDGAGNTDPTPASFTWTIDLTAPDTTITSTPTNPSNSTSPSFTFTSTEPGTFECRLDGAAFAVCTSPRSYTGLAAGSHTFDVRAKDTAGNLDPTPASYTWTIDTTAPNTTITSSPSSPTTSTVASFTFTSTEAGTFECRLDGAAYAACTSPRSYVGLADGSHTFDVRATDSAGNVDPTPATSTWIVDTAAPNTTITAGPGDPTSSTNASFSFTATETGTFACSLDGGAFATCTSPRSYTGLSAGSHTFEVRATDTAGNTDPTAATFTWTIDTTAPETTIDSGPSGTVTSSSASFAFSSEPGATFECSLDGAAYAACTSPQGYIGLADGSHTFQVRAKDAAGNTDPSPAARSWTIDTGAPETAIDSGPSGTVTSSSAGFAFSSEPGATFECSLDGAAFAFCTSPQLLTGLSDGAHTFAVRAKDAAGNTDATPATRTWTIDATAPDTTLDSGPPDPSSSADATLSFSSEPGATFQCSLDGAAFAVCTSPQSYTGLASGTHAFEVRAVDAAGNVDATPASHSWTIDTAAPETSIDGGPSGTVTNSSASFTFSSEPGATFQCSLDGAAFGACTSPQSYAALADGSHTFDVRARDAAGNTDPTPASRAWTVDATAPATSLDSTPPIQSGSTDATFVFSSEPGATFECSLDGAAFGACTSPHGHTGLSEGSHTFEVRATDANGNTDPTPAAWTWTVDTTAPETTVDSAPPDPDTSTDASFVFSSEPGATFECSLDAGAFAPCVSPQAYTALAAGTHVFEVRAVDGAGNQDGTPAAYTWTISP